MSKHTNKHWIREKKYLSLKSEYSYLWDTLPRSRRWGRPLGTRLKEIERKLEFEFYNEEYGTWQTAPRWYRNMLNRKQRVKSKKVLYKIIHYCDDYVFEDNYKDCNWYW